MSDASSFRLGDLQLRIMRVLWRCGPLGVAEVRERLDGDDLAYTTVATMLRKMEDRGLVATRRRTADSSTVRPSTSTTSPAAWPTTWSIASSKAASPKQSATCCKPARSTRTS